MKNMKKERRGMKIAGIIESAEFFEKVALCKGSVELLTSEGDVLNLKSKLCQYIALTQMFDDGIVGAFELRLSDESDYEMIKHYLIPA